MDRDAILRANEAARKPFDPREQADDDEYTHTSQYAGLMITRGELERAGLTPDDVPNVRLIDPELQNQEYGHDD